MALHCLDEPLAMVHLQDFPSQLSFHVLLIYIATCSALTGDMADKPALTMVSVKELPVLAEMASLGKPLEHATFIFSMIHAMHVIQSCFSLVAHKTAYIILHVLLVLLCGNFFSVIHLGHKHAITYIYLLSAFQKTGTIVALPLKTPFIKKRRLL